jgi:hypothetical protein
MKEKAEKMLYEDQERQQEREDFMNIRKEIEMEEKCTKNKVRKHAIIFTLK